DPLVAELAIPLHRRALREREAISQRLVDRAEHIVARGGQAQVRIRPACALSFFHPEGPSGPRYRLRADGDRFSLAGGSGTFERRELEAKMEASPLDFSTSALLR